MIGYLTPDGVNPFRPAKTTNAADVFTPPAPPAAPKAETDELARPTGFAQLRALLNARQKVAK
jgi:hypothetical protein